MLPQQKRNLIDAAIAAGRQATRSRTGQITLALGAADRVHYIKLADEFGLTEAGEYYYEQTQEVRPIRGVDLAQIPYSLWEGGQRVHPRPPKQGAHRPHPLQRGMAVHPLGQTLLQQSGLGSKPSSTSRWS